jgi:hypothetical protein
MQKEQFETRIKELLPNMTEQAMDKWEDYAQYLLEEEEETSDFFYDAVYVELCLIKQHQGEQTATSLFNYGEHFVFNYFELRGAAALLTDGWALDKIRDFVIKSDCDPTQEEYEESQNALRDFRKSEGHPEEKRLKDDFSW